MITAPGSIARSALGWPWPSVQRDSEALRVRLEWQRRAELVRATWHAPTLRRAA